MATSTAVKVAFGLIAVGVGLAVAANGVYLGYVDNQLAKLRISPKQRKLLELQDAHSTVSTFINDPAFAEYKTLLEAADKRCTEAKLPEVTEEALADAVVYVNGILHDVNDLKKSEIAE